jgi:hypothetical protein
MPRQETVLSVFVASPSDVDEERNRLEDAIRELNVTWARDLGVRLELIRWETHAYPGFGADAQDVVNSQVPDDFDIFIGLMWYRFGTPTGRAGSGTHEEFLRAKTRFDADPTSLQLMIYFKDEPAPVPPSKLDYGQLAKITDFRNSLGKEGALYWSYSSPDDFEKFVRLHLTRQVQAWRNRHLAPKELQISANPHSNLTTSNDCELGDGSDDAGVLDLMIQFEDEFASLLEIANRISIATEEIGVKMVERTRETNAFRDGPDATNRKAATRVINRAANDMEQYVFRMDAELPLFSKHLNDGMSAMVKAAAIVVDINLQGEDLEQLLGNVHAIRSFRDSISTTIDSMSSFRDSVAALPRLTTILNRAKRGVTNVLQRLINEFESAHRMAKEAEATFETMYEIQDTANNNPINRSGGSAAS